MALTLNHDRKKRIAKQNEEYRKKKEAAKAQNYGKLLTAAMNHPAIKSSFFGDEKITAGRIDLSIEDQLELLETYVRVLEREYNEFIAKFPDRQGQAAAKEFLDLRKDALEHIAFHRAGLAQVLTESETGMIRPSREALARMERIEREREQEEKQRVIAARRG